MKSFYSNGKLLLTGEYVVLDGATALAVPTTFGQTLLVKNSEHTGLHWKSLDHQDEIWFKEEFQLKEGTLKKHSSGGELANRQVSETLQKLLNAAHNLNPEIFREGAGFSVTSKLSFPRDWGLGSSSTLVNNIAQWFNVDPYYLLEKTFGGSGYDIASAQHDQPVTFAINPGGKDVFAAAFDPEFKNQLFFVHLNRKQSSRDSIAHYRSQAKEELRIALEKISSITHQMIATESLIEFELLIEIHETIISKLVNTPKIKLRLFPDYPRKIKSLGGWGGDFVLATGDEQEKNYFRKKGYNTILGYREMVR